LAVFGVIKEEVLIHFYHPNTIDYKYMKLNYEELFELEKMGYIKGSNTKLALEKSKTYMKGR